MTLPITLDWRAADAAYTGISNHYFDFCIELGKLHIAGATQHQIAARYDISQASVAQAIAIGRDNRIISSANNLPKSQYTLYLLTTLDDTGFEALASPDTTRQKVVLDYTGKGNVGKAPASPSVKRSDPEGEVAKLKAEIAMLKHNTDLSQRDAQSQREEYFRMQDECRALQFENSRLKSEVAALKVALKAADDVVKAADVVVKTATNMVKPKPETPEPVKPVKVKASKPETPKPETPEPITDRNAKIIELHCMAKAYFAKNDPEYPAPEIDVWIKDIFLANHNLPKDIRDLPSFKEKSVDNKIAYFNDATFAKLCATTAARY